MGTLLKLRGSETLLSLSVGIWTGSIVPDYQLYHGGFYGEVTANEKVILIKTHGFGKKSSKAGFKKAVLLIRKPQESVLAKWNQQKTRTHTGIAKGETYDTEGSFSGRWSWDTWSNDSRWLIRNGEIIRFLGQSLLTPYIEPNSFSRGHDAGHIESHRTLPSLASNSRSCHIQENLQALDSFSYGIFTHIEKSCGEITHVMRTIR